MLKHGVQMEKHVKNVILNKVHELDLLLKESPEYLRFQEVTKQMKNNNDVMNLIKKIKRIQKDIVNLEYRRQNVSLLEKELNTCLNELNEYPIYQEYSYLLEDLNNTFQSIKSILEEHINYIVKQLA